MIFNYHRDSDNIIIQFLRLVLKIISFRWVLLLIVRIIIL